jgi:hypothetical protein
LKFKKIEALIIFPSRASNPTKKYCAKFLKPDTSSFRYEVFCKFIYNSHQCVSAQWRWNFPSQDLLSALTQIKKRVRSAEPTGINFRKTDEGNIRPFALKTLAAKHQNVRMVHLNYMSFEF